MTVVLPRTIDEWRIAFKGAYRKLDEAEAKVLRAENQLHDCNDGLTSVRLDHDLARKRLSEFDGSRLPRGVDMLELNRQADVLFENELTQVSNQSRASIEYEKAIDEHKHRQRILSYLQQCFDIWQSHQRP